MRILFARTMKCLRRVLLPVGILLLGAIHAQAQERTVGTIINDAQASEGYTLFAPLGSGNTYLIDNEGRQIRSWTSVYKPGLAVYLLESGELLRTGQKGTPGIFDAGGGGGIVERFDWEGDLLWTFEYSDSEKRLHHDVEALPNGNVLMIAWEAKTAAEAIAAGRNPALLGDDQLWPEKIIEVEPDGSVGGRIVWEWHAWDHLVQDFDSAKPEFAVITEHPELINLNWFQPGLTGRQADWLHINSVKYNSRLDQIVLSVHNFSEIWVIDHSTTTEEAAGHSGGRSGKGGDLLYRWGNPAAWGMSSGGRHRLLMQHDAQWIADSLPGAGNILVFNNGGGLPGQNFSSVDEIETPVDERGRYLRTQDSVFAPAVPLWSYTAQVPSDFYAKNISGAQRLPNGNTLVCDGPAGTLFEVTPQKAMVWKYINPVTNLGILAQYERPRYNRVFKVCRYPPEYPGFAGRTLTPGDPIERYPMDIDDPLSLPSVVTLHPNVPNPFTASTTIRVDLAQAGPMSLRIFDMLGRHVRTLSENDGRAGTMHLTWDGTDEQGRLLPAGMYTCALVTDDEIRTQRMLLLR